MNPKKSLSKLRNSILLPVFLTFMLCALSLNAYAAPKDRTPPAAPAGLTAAANAAYSSVSLSWKASSDNVGVKSYTVYQGTTAKLTTTALTATISGLTPSTTYLFTVKAKDAAGNISAASNAVKFTAGSAVKIAQTAVTTSGAKKLIGYYAGWSTYSGKQVSGLDAAKLTHINYAFANIDKDLNIALGDPYADVEKVFPGDLSTDPFHGNFNQLVKLKKKYPHLRTLISVGGWTGSAKFSDAALTNASRTAFADSCVAFILKYGFDGIDIDWEYPVGGGLAGNINRPADTANFTLLMQKLREKLDAQAAKDGKKYLLSFAGGASSYYANHVELAKLQAYTDFVNIMAYDLHGTWESKTGLNAPLYKDPGSGFTYETSVNDTVGLYLNKGVPSSKLVMGVPFYGYRYDNVAKMNNGLYQAFKGGASLTYSQILTGYIGKGYTRHVQSTSKVPYLFNGSSFITYEDPESIGYKADYVKSQGLAGAMVWELSQDSANKDLLQTLYQRLQ